MDQERLYKTLPPTTDQDEHDVEEPLAPDWLEVLNRQESSSFYRLYSPSMKEWDVDLRGFDACSKRAAQIMQQVRSRPDRIGAVQAATVRIPHDSSKNQKRIDTQHAESTTGSGRATNENIHRQEMTNGLQQIHPASASAKVPQSRRSDSVTSIAINQIVRDRRNGQDATTDRLPPRSIPASVTPSLPHLPTNSADGQIRSTSTAVSAGPSIPTSTAQLAADTSDKPRVSRANHLRATCNCRCGCSQSYYARKTGTSIRCAPCIKGNKSSRCAEPAQTGAHAASSQLGGNHQPQPSAQVPPTMPHLPTAQPMPSTARPTTAAHLSRPSHTMAQPQPRGVTELQRPDYGSDQSAANGASQQSSSSRLKSAAADHCMQNASVKGTREVEQTAQTSQASTTTDEVKVSSRRERSPVHIREFVSTDQSRRATEKGQGKRKVQNDDEDLQRALAKSEDKRQRMGETGQDGWRRSF
ncbi:hypothetical protein LTR49_003668 [Elasticomyces elasticus]|nr:hypothetical protein LTR49_003668 [Elasticomyces elasticus]